MQSDSDEDNFHENSLVDKFIKNYGIEASTSACTKTSRKRTRESSSSSSEEVENDEIIYVPDNPKKWTESDISAWIRWTTKTFKLAGSIDSEKFPRKAEELAMFNKAEFYIACGSFEGGEKVARHYKHLMDVVHETCHESLSVTGEPGQFFLFLRIKCVFPNVDIRFSESYSVARGITQTLFMS